MLKYILKLFGNSEKQAVPDFKPDEVKNVLIVRQHNQLGDMLCSVPLFSAIRKKFHSAHITLVASPINYEILFSDINPYIDKVITYRKSSLKNLLDFYKELKNHNYQIGIVPSTVSISRTSHLINYFSGAKIRVGVKSIDGRYNSVEYLLNVKSDFDWDLKKMHQVDRNLDVGSQIDCGLTDKEKDEIMIHLSQEEIEAAEKFMNESFPVRDKLVISFHPGAGKIPNRWSVENFAELIQLIHKKYECYILLTSGTVDKEVTDSLSNNLKRKNIGCVILENTPIRKVGAVIKKTDLYITNDTGTMHVAGGVNANVISLFGPTHGYEWAPKGKNKIYIQSPSDNINDISAEEVFNSACKLIGEATKEGKLSSTSNVKNLI